MAVEERVDPAATGTAGATGQDSARSGGLWARILQLPPFVLVAAIFVGGRILTSTILNVFSQAQLAQAFSPAQPDLANYGAIWDGMWYSRIAEGGYPTELPRNAEGFVTENAWAFMPLFPFAARIVMAITGMPFAAAGMFVSLVFGLLATWMFFKLARRILSLENSLWVTLLFSILPVSAMFQVSYAEGMGLFFILLALHYLIDRRYLAVAITLPFLAFSRPSGLVFALTLGMYFVFRIINRKTDPWTRFEPAKIVSLGIAAVLLGFSWVWIAGIVTGDPHAYTDTEFAWRRGYVSEETIIPVINWVNGMVFWIGMFTGIGGWFGAALGILVTLIEIALFVYIFRSKPVRALPLPLQMWSWAYALYLIGVFFPQSSTWRLMLPLAPLVIALAVVQRVWARILLVAVLVALQILWLWNGWYVMEQDWSPP